MTLHEPPDWLERDKHIIGGLDHLGIEVVSSTIYAMLLPGISNLTERARYFAVYPWVLHQFAQQSEIRRGKKEWRTWIRRLEFAYSLASAAFERNNGRGATDAAGVVGAVAARRTVRKLAPAARVDLASHTAVNGKGRGVRGSYFRHGEGGYGQYYKGPLTSLGALMRSKQEHPNRQLTGYAGVKLAEATAAAPGFDDLLQFALEGSASLDELVDIGRDVCPGAMAARSDEAERIRGLLLGADDDLCAGQRGSDRSLRRQSFMLMLHLVKACRVVEGDFVGVFRRACFERALPDGKAWRVPDGLRATCLGWGAYQRNELFNYALECFFWAALQAIHEKPWPPRTLAQELARLGCAKLSSDDDVAASPVLQGDVASVVKACHVTGVEEGAIAWALALTTEDDIGRTCALAARLLAWLGVPDAACDSHPFEALPDAVRYAAVREVHLAEWLSRVREHRDRSFAELLEQIILEWVLFRHLRVATRKLASQGDSTFKFRPEQGALIPAADEIPLPTFTNPRVREAHRMLGDMHLLRIEGDRTTVTDRGEQALRSMG